MMRRNILLLVVLAVFYHGFALAQLVRLGQLEVYGGVAIPIAPEEFKDFYKVGLSLNAQYVFFPLPQMGIPVFAGYEIFTVDNAAINEEFTNLIVGPVYDDFGNYLGDVTGGNLDTKGSASAFRFGAGLRPYLTPQVSPVQIFLFGNVSYNFLTEETELKGGEVTFQDVFGNTQTFSLEDLGIQPSSDKVEEDKAGLAIGAGIEVPAGPTMNLIFQGLYHIIFTEDESTSFLGVTAGLVF